MAEAAEEIPIVEDIVGEDGDDISNNPMTLYMIVGYGAVLVAVIGGAWYYFMGLGRAARTKKDQRGKDVDVDDVAATNTVGLEDVSYLADQLHPKSSHMDVLMAVASTPENVAYGLKVYHAKEKTRQKRLQEDQEEAKKKNESAKSTKAETAKSSEMFGLDDEGWADEDADDEKVQAAQKADEQKQKEREELQKAVGKTKLKLEGIDEGVIGQQWVERTLGAKGVWPPKDLGILKGKTFDFDGKKVSALDHPGLRRNLCMITGRTNSIMLNSHPELLEAGSTGLVDQTYFKRSMEFRGRCALLLEAALRTAVACRNYALCKTIVETVGLFKIGTTSPDKIEWFDAIMQKQYQVLPRLKIENTSMECVGESEMATGDVLAISLELTREHAEAFTRQKIAMFQKQGIPPQVALKSYREGWWFLARAKRLDGDVPASALDLKTDGILKEAAKEAIAKFENATFEERLVTAWPMVVQNVAQKSGKVKIQFIAPPVPGKYKFTVSVKSQDFLGADQEFTVEGTIVDASTVTRTPKEEKEEKDPVVKKDN